MSNRCSLDASWHRVSGPGGLLVLAFGDGDTVGDYGEGGNEIGEHWGGSKWIGRDKGLWDLSLTP